MLMKTPRRDHTAEMAALERRFKTGDKLALVDALFVCICSHPRKEVPQWAERALARARHDVFMARAISWDDVFGKPHAKRKIPQLRQERALRWKVFCRVMQLRHQKPKPKNIFQEVAVEMKLERPTVKRYFERERKLVQQTARILNQT
jgi:hypothetical protein